MMMNSHRIIAIEVMVLCSILRVESISAVENQKLEQIDSILKSLPDRNVDELLSLTSAINDQLWDRFQKSKGGEKLDAAIVMAFYPPPNVDRRAALRDHLRNARHEYPKKSDEYSEITIALAMLDDSEAEIELLARILREGKPKPEIVLGLPGPGWDMRAIYLDARGKKRYLVSRLRSSNRELRNIAWQVLKSFYELPEGVEFEPEMSPDGQRVMLDRLEKWSRESEK